MQAYQSPPCPYCGITWNQPGAQTCANCRNPLPPPQAGFAPPGYQNYPPPQYPGPPPGYQGQQGYPGYGPPGYPEQPGYAQDPGYATYAPAEAAHPGTTLRILGQTVTVPVALPAIVVRYVPAIVNIVIGLVVALVLVAVVIPQVALAQISSAKQSLLTAASHQAKVDDAFTQFFNAKTYTGDPTAFKAQFDKQAKSFSAGLALVKSDEAAVLSVDQRLSVLEWVAPSKRAAISAQRDHLTPALVGLRQADQALTAAVNEANVIQPYTEALIDYTKIAAALPKRDLVAAGAPYPDAQQKIQQAMSYSHAAGVPPQMAKQVSSFNDLLTNSESLVQAIQAKDSPGIKKATDAINAAVKAMSSPDETVPADYENKSFGSNQKAYDAAMKMIKSAS